MNDASKNKVCFDCAGKPVIRRIVENMQAAGISQFVLVVGHQAQSVMESLVGIDGIAYAFQAEQKGTGHAVQCGLKTLQSMGFEGKAVVSMGDKIVATPVIAELVQRAGEADVVWGVQPVKANPGGGRIIEADGKPFGVVELADIAYQSLAGVPEASWDAHLSSLGLNAKKARKVRTMASEHKPAGSVTLNGRRFSVAELLSARYSNAGLYCFDVGMILEALGKIGSNNAQGEIYLTDALEQFAIHRRRVALFEVSRPEQMLTFSTKPELRKMSRFFLRKASEFLSEIRSGALDEAFQELYGDRATGQRERYAGLVEAFLKKYGDEKVILTRAPGRVNLMGRHIDHRGGNTNVMTIDRDTVMVVSPREDDIVHIANLDGAYTEAEFSISQHLNLAPEQEEWLDYLDAPAVKAALAAERGHWVNYIKSAVLRFQRAMDFPLCGMNLMATGNIPTGAGLSSSSALVVATGEALVGLNCLNLNARQFVDLCGEGEWYVGSRGGAGDHAAMKFGQRGKIVQLYFKPFSIGESYDFSEKYVIVVADSQQQAKKSEGSRDAFNARVAAYEFGFLLLRKIYPQYGWREFRELAEVDPQAEIYRMLKRLPEFVSRAEVLELLPTQHEKLHRIFETHAEPAEGYALRAVVLYGISECLRAKRLGDLLNAGDYCGIGEMMKISQNGDRRNTMRFTDELLDDLAAKGRDVALECGAYNCSTERIDSLCDLLDSLPGVLGSSLVGAGLGGSIIALVEKAKAEDVLRALEEKFYAPLGTSCKADMYVPSAGSSALF